MRSINDDTTVNDNAATTIENLYTAISQAKVPSGDMQLVVYWAETQRQDTLSSGDKNTRTRRLLGRNATADTREPAVHKGYKVPEPVLVVCTAETQRGDTLSIRDIKYPSPCSSFVPLKRNAGTRCP